VDAIHPMKASKAAKKASRQPKYSCRRSKRAGKKARAASLLLR
jgi:hypothetical protein